MAEGKITLDEARELVSNPVLWSRIRDFLWDFAPSIHRTWIEEKLGSLEVLKFGLGDDRTSKHPNIKTSIRIKRFVLSSLGVEPCFHTFPKDDGSRLLLLDGATLLEIAKWLGALACADELRKVTDGKTVRALKAALPGVYPEVFGYTAYFGSLEVWKFGGLEVETVDGEKNIAETVISIGHAILFSAVSSLPASLVSRLKLKLPNRETSKLRNFETSKLLNFETSKPQNFETSKPLNFQTSIFKLLKLKFPEDCALCCS